MPLVKAFPTKTFTRDNPATKVDLALCFWDGKGFIARPVIQSRGIIGLNVPKYLLKHALAETVMDDDTEVEYLRLTLAGKHWLVEGLDKHLRRHPDHAARLAHGRPQLTSTRRPAPASAPPRRPRTPAPHPTARKRPR